MNTIVKREESRNITITLRRDMRIITMKREKRVERRCSDQIVTVVIKSIVLSFTDFNDQL